MTVFVGRHSFWFINNSWKRNWLIAGGGQLLIIRYLTFFMSKTMALTYRAGLKAFNLVNEDSNCDEGGTDIRYDCWPHRLMKVPVHLYARKSVKSPWRRKIIYGGRRKMSGACRRSFQHLSGDSGIGYFPAQKGKLWISVQTLSKVSSRVWKMWCWAKDCFREN